MAKFVRNKPVQSDAPNVKVELATGEQLDLGANRFKLVVVDDAGNESEPAFIDVIVKDAAKPTAVLDLVDGNGKVLGDLTVKQGDTIILSGARSKDQAPGKVVSYTFTWIDRG
ncbi:hypothetical protein [Qipengyuania sp.]|uniref:hypothetical protein n=1 Tax=Qipengyuania sp. TaxID=2004515 RepID=UPI003AF97540